MTKEKSETNSQKQFQVFSDPPIGIGKSTYPDKILPANDWFAYIRQEVEKNNKLKN